MSDGEGKTVLVVDDEPDIITITRVMLQNSGFKVLTADNGLDAVKAVYQHQPDCVILDVMMPRMNGYQVCRLLKHDERTRNTPIILCTVKSLEMDRLYGLTAGADFYITKPFDPGDMLKQVNSAIRQGARARAKAPPLSDFSTDAILTEINQLLDKKLREYTILQYVSRAIAGTLNLDDLLSIILRSTTTDLGYPRGFFLLMSESGVMEERLNTDEVWRRKAWKGRLEDHPELQAILAKGLPRVVEYPEVEEVIPQEILMSSIGMPMAVVPVVAKGRILGAILVECGEATGCGEDTLGFFLTLAGQAGLAIENAQLYAKTLKLSITDGLTDLYNYRYLMERLEAEFSRAKRYGRELSIFILDIDHFKNFNDQFGHLKGDTALRQLADILKNSVREVDVVARYGGEEFAIILPETEIREAVVFAERIRKAVATTWTEVGQMTASIGVASVTAEVGTAEDLIRRSDEALYQAKKLGRNRVCQVP